MKYVIGTLVMIGSFGFIRFGLGDHLNIGHVVLNAFFFTYMLPR